jgi:hypothetical protein
MMSLRAMAGLAICLCTGGLAAVPTPAPASERLAEGRISPEGLIFSVIEYTRWPVAGKPALLCVTSGGPRGADVVRALQARPPAQRLEAREVEPNRSPPSACDVLLFEGWDPASLRAVLRAQSDRPVMSIGFGPGFCSDGGILCLALPNATDRHFEINLDAVARSGLRINPRVLQLARPTRKPA